METTSIAKVNGTTKRGATGEPIFAQLDGAAAKGIATSALIAELRNRRAEAENVIGEIDSALANTASAKPVEKVSAPPARKAAVKRAAKTVKGAVKKAAKRTLKAAPVAEKAPTNATAPKAKAGGKTIADYAIDAICAGAKTPAEILGHAERAGWKTDSAKPGVMINLALVGLKKAGKLVQPKRGEYTIAK